MRFLRGELFGKERECSFYDLTAADSLLLGRQMGIAGGIGDGLSAGNTGSAHGLGNGGNGTDVSGGNAGLFNLFDDRCTATSTGTSSGGEDHAVNTCG